METILMQPQMDDDEDFGIDMNQYSQQQNEVEDDDLESSSIDMNSYSTSQEAEKATWWDLAKDVVIQPALGAARKWTWPADILKLGMIGEALDTEGFEREYEKQGKKFDKSAYLKAVSEFHDFVPTQGLIEDKVGELSGIDLEPKTDTGKFINKLFTLRGFLKGSQARRAASAGAGASATTGLKAAGVNETAADLTGDIVAGGVNAAKSVPKTFSPEVEQIKKTADKYGLPFMEYMTKDQPTRIKPWITQRKENILKDQIGMSSEQAINEIVEGRISIAALRKKGTNLDILEDAAYDQSKKLAAANPQPLSTSEIVNDIEREIKRIESLAPSPSDGQKARIAILRDEQNALKDKTPNAQELINQTQNYNSNVKSIYRKAQFSGVEDEVKNAYAFLNDTIRTNLGKQTPPELLESIKNANKIFGENASLARTEGLIEQAFKDGNYDPKRLQKMLESRKGVFLRRDLGDAAVTEIKEIADYGVRAVNATKQLSQTRKYSHELADWGTIAPFLLGSTKTMKGLLFAAKPAAQYIQGLLLTRPATRTIYRNIVKNAAEGSFNNMKADFGALEKEISKEFGSVDEFMKQVVSELELATDEDFL